MQQHHVNPQHPRYPHLINVRKNTMTLLDLAIQANLNPKWAACTQGGEWKSSCPACGGTDRFIMQSNKQQKNCTGFYFCRRCEISGDTIQFAMDYLGYTFLEATNLIGVTIENITKQSLFKTPYKLTSIPLIKFSPTWQQQATHYLDQAHAKLLINRDALTYLAIRGLPLKAVICYQFGWSDQDQYLVRTDWDLAEEKKEDGTYKKLWLPKGLIIPTIDFNKIIRLKTRRTDWHEGDVLPKYVAVSGSAEGLNIIGNRKSKIMIVVESELDAYALHHAVDDFAVMVAVGGCTKEPDAVTNRMAEQKTVLICSDADAAGKTMWNKWKQLYPHAIKCSTPIGKDIGETIEQGLDLRPWIISKLPEQIQYELKLVKQPWSAQDQLLIDWILDYINPKVTTSPFYTALKNEIDLGPTSQRAQTQELQTMLILMKELAENRLKIYGKL